jgi:hypothetical protein
MFAFFGSLSVSGFLLDKFGFLFSQSSLKLWTDLYPFVLRVCGLGISAFFSFASLEKRKNIS